MAYEEKIVVLKSTLHKNKEISYEQKNDFLELQSQVFHLEELVEEFEEEERKHRLEMRHNERYSKLDRIRLKVQAQKENENEEATRIIEKKINEAALIRANMLLLD